MKDRPVKVTWHDAASSDVWTPEAHATAYRPYVVESYGLLIRKDKKVVTLALNKSDRGQYSCIIEIPAGIVRSIQYLR